MQHSTYANPIKIFLSTNEESWFEEQQSKDLSKLWYQKH